MKFSPLNAALLLSLPLSQFANAISPREYRGDKPVIADKHGDLFLEAEEFKPARGAWKAMDWGDNYYVGTFANSFLSRKGFLGAPEQSEKSVATINAEIPAAGTYYILARYEAAYRFETQFTVVVEQNGKVVFSRLYGANDNVKIWAFKGISGGLQKDFAWPWGATENIVWEGHEATVNLQKGAAKISLIADKQPEPAAKRNVDVLMVTPHGEQIARRLEKEGYLPLDGLLTQREDLWVRVTNLFDAPVTVTFPLGQEHAPYNVHMRDNKPFPLTVEGKTTSSWHEMGSMLDTLNDGQWRIKAQTGKDPKAPVKYKIEFATKEANSFKPFSTFEVEQPLLRLVYDGDLRYHPRMRTEESVLSDLLASIKAEPFTGKTPKLTPIYFLSFDPIPENEKYMRECAEFNKMFTGEPNDCALFWLSKRGNQVVGGQRFPLQPVSLEKPWDSSNRAGVAIGNNIPVSDIENMLLTAFPAPEVRQSIVTVSLGDEIGLPQPKAGVPESDAALQAWGKEHHLTPVQLAPSAKDWSEVVWQIPTPELKASHPEIYYYLRTFAQDYGIEQMKSRTSVIRKMLPNAQIGANFSPHHGVAPFLGETTKWITLFRREGMTMPWSEDYIWQVPIGSQQMNFISLDQFRAGNRYHQGRSIHFYVMPHTPGNTVNSWRRQFYGDLGSGATHIDLFEFRPVAASATENHTTDPKMYQEIRRSFGELGKFEDIVQKGAVRQGDAALWYSRAGDAWDNQAAPYGANKRTLYIAARHQGQKIDIVDEEDALKGTLKNYKLIYLTDTNVSKAASNAIVDWVKQGGRLFATAGAGTMDEFNRPNTILPQLMGFEQKSIALPQKPIRFEKQDLPFASSVETALIEDGSKIDVYDVVSHVSLAGGATALGTFKSGEPAVIANRVGAGETIYCAFLAGLSYFKPALPKIPVDRGNLDSSLAHFIPTNFDTAADALIGRLGANLPLPLQTNNKLVQTDVIQSSEGAVITLTNWSATPANGLEITLNASDLPAKSVTMASGKPVQVKQQNGKTVLTLDLPVADAVILRK